MKSEFLKGFPPQKEWLHRFWLSLVKTFQEFVWICIKRGRSNNTRYPHLHTYGSASMSSVGPVKVPTPVVWACLQLSALVRVVMAGILKTGDGKAFFSFSDERTSWLVFRKHLHSSCGMLLFSRRRRNGAVVFVRRQHGDKSIVYPSGCFMTTHAFVSVTNILSFEKKRRKRIHFSCLVRTSIIIEINALPQK